VGEGQFNIVDFANRIGLKNISSMPIVESIQPVSIVGDNADLTPAFHAPSGIGGASENAHATQRIRFEVFSLGAGGCLVDGWITAGSTNFRVNIGTGLLVAGDDTLTQVTSNIAPQTVVRANSNAAVPSANTPIIGANQPLPFGRPIYIPRGQSLMLVQEIPNFSASCAIFFRDVPATEHGPA